MKRFILLAVLFMTAVMGETAHAVFTFAFDGASVQTIAFGTLKPGDVNFDIPPSGKLFQLNSTSDQGLPYAVTINSTQPLTHTTDPAFTISNDNFFWFSTFTTGAGTKTADATRFSNPLKTVYQGVAADANGATIVVQLKFGLVVPSSGIRAGTYGTTVSFTMTE